MNARHVSAGKGRGGHARQAAYRTSNGGRQQGTHGAWWRARGTHRGGRTVSSVLRMARAHAHTSERTRTRAHPHPRRLHTHTHSHTHPATQTCTHPATDQPSHPLTHRLRGHVGAGGDHRTGGRRHRIRPRPVRSMSLPTSAGPICMSPTHTTSTGAWHAPGGGLTQCHCKPFSPIRPMSFNNASDQGRSIHARATPPALQQSTHTEGKYSHFASSECRRVHVGP